MSLRDLIYQGAAILYYPCNLSEKVKIQKQMKIVESKREALWEEIDTARREIDNKKEALIDDVEKHLGKKLANRNYLR